MTILCRCLFFLVLFNNVLFASALKYVEVITTETVVLETPTANAHPLWLTKKGSVFEYLSQTSDFTEIKLTKKTAGWLYSTDIKLILPDVSVTQNNVALITKNYSAEYTYDGQEDYRFPRRSSNVNFDLTVDGFYETKLSGRDYSEKGNDNLQKIKNDPYYKKIPKNVLQGDYKIDQRSQINVEGKLSEDLYVHYDIIQEEDMPAKYDISIEYKKNHLQFHHLNSSYRQGDFINVSKKLTGMQYKHNGNENFFQLSMGKERSDSASTGDIFGQEGVSKYKIGKTYIFPGSVSVWKNSNEQTEGKDYTIDYYAGEITFTTPLSNSDYFKVVYEKSNPIADYLPLLARRNFQGVQYEKKAQVQQYSELTANSYSTEFTYFPQEAIDSTIHFSPMAFSSIPSFNLSDYAELEFLLISENILNNDLTIHASYPPSRSVLSLFNDTKFVSFAYTIADNIDLFHQESLAYDQFYNGQFSTTQVFPDEFFLIDGLNLQDSLDIFNYCQSKQLLDSQGFIVNNILTVSSVFDINSPFYAYNNELLNFLKLKFIDENPTKKYRYILQHQSIVLGSESIFINSELLNPNTDYYLDYTLGLLTFNLPFVASDNVKIAYDYYTKSFHSEDIIGKNSKGIYPLAHYPVVDGSFKLYLDSVLLTEINDYILDYDTGELYFNFEVAFPQIISVQYNYIPSVIIEEKGKKQTFDYSVTYLNQFLPAEEELLETSVSSENVTVTNNIITLTNTPIINTENIKISINDVIIAPSSYEISSEYKSEILLLTTENITSAEISYTYAKSYQSKFIFHDLNKSQTYTISNDSSSGFVDLPIKHNGINYFSLYDASENEEYKLEEGEDFEIVSYGDPNNEDGSYLVFSFLNNNTSSIIYDYGLPVASDRLTIYYDYTPSISDALPDITHEMFGTTIRGNINNEWSIDGEFAVARNNISSKIIESDPITLNGNGIANYYFSVGQKNIVENSEQIYFQDLNNNLSLQTKDRDYYFNYDNGTFRFKNNIPESDDEIVVYFNYYDTKNLSSSDTQTSYATKLSTQYDSPTVKANAAVKYIDKDFAPIGNIKDAKGNTEFTSGIDWNITPTLNVSSGYSRKKLYLKENEENISIYKHTDLFTTNINNTLFNLIQANQSFRYQFDLSDPENEHLGDSTHATDQLIYSYNGNFNFGPSYMKNTVARSFSRQYTDYRDQISPANTRSNSTSYKSNMNFDDVFILRKVKFTPSYLYSTSESSSSSSSRNSFSAISTITPLSFLSFSPSYSQSSSYSEKSDTTSSTEAQSYGSSANFTPFSWISTAFSYNHKETESPLINQKSNINESRSASVKKLTPYTAFRAMGFSKNNYFSRMFYNTNLSYSYNGKEGKTSNRKKITSSETNRFSLTQIMILPKFVIKNISYHFSDSNTDNNVASTTTSRNYSTNDNTSFSTNFGFTPSFSIFKYMKYFGDISEKTTLSTSTTEATAVTGNNTLSTVYEHKITHGLSFNSPQLSIPFLFTKNDKLRLGKFSFGINQSVFNKKNDNKAYDYLYNTSTNSYENDLLTNNELDNQNQNKLSITSSVSPFNLITLKTTAQFDTNYLNRNKFISGQTTYQDTESYSCSTSFSPFSFLSFSSSGSFSEYTQWVIPSINVSIDELTTTLEDTLERINNKSIQANLSTTFKPFRLFSFSGTFAKKYIAEDVADNFLDDISPFNTETFSLGLNIFPFKNFSIKSSFDFSETWQTDRAASQRGESNTQTVSYTPIKTSNSSISIHYSRIQQFGSGLNDLDQSLTEQETGDKSQTSIVTRDNVIQSSSINVSITYPINNVYVNSFVFTAEGYFKDITDNVTANNSYNLSGLLAKGTLNF